MKNKLIHPKCKNKDCDRPAINGEYCDRCTKKKKENFKGGILIGIGGIIFTVLSIISPGFIKPIFEKVASKLIK